MMRQFRVAVAQRLGVCKCGAQVDDTGVHSFVCKRATGKIARHHAINDIFARSLASADVSSTKEPNGLLTKFKKRSDDLSLLPCSGVNMVSIKTNNIIRVCWSLVGGTLVTV